MAHQSLYRAYRPQQFKDVIGQEQVTGALQESIKNEKVGHAYLFSGSRGLGKTSIARIFARELGTTDKDLYEIDAASNTQVDHMRELIDNVYTLPFDSKYKVYILDEAHMLSKSAWNAFLKTLEEPPAHVIFILATTELEKVPETVQSRCQVFEFKKPTREGLAKLIASVAKKEGFTIEPSAADLLALLANGSYRDALSVLEKALSATTDTTLTREEAERATGTPRHEMVDALVRALGAGNTSDALQAIRTAEDASVDMNLFLALVIEHVRNVLLVRHAPELRASLKTELGETYAGTEEIANSGTQLTHTALRVLLDAAARMRYAPVAALPLELAVYELFA